MELLVISILILLNGFFALSEIALISSKKSRLEQYKAEGRKGSKTALLLLKDSENFLSAIQVGITLIGIVTGVYGGVSLADDITPLFQRIDFLENSAKEIALVMTVLVITYFSILFGELVPKTIALSNPEKIAVRISPVIYYLCLMFYPVVKFLSYSTSLINKLIGVRKHSEQITEADLRYLLRMASRDGIIEKNQNLIHQKVFYFSDKKAKHIMTHRMEVEWINTDLPYMRIKEKIIKSRHNRLVCSSGNLDDFQGILNVKDFLAADLPSIEVFDPGLLIQPVIVPESADVHKILDLFKQKQVHFCIVVNEFGSLEGIITLHDILENLIGNIPAEGESSEPDVYIRDDKSYLVNGDAPAEILDGIFENYITDLENIDYSTVAGFVLDNIKKSPQVGDKFSFGDYSIEVVDIDGNRVDKVLIKKNIHSSADEE
jgi:putative hemolysin